jgi:abortive infection bacteriophage resistance protein
MVEILTFGQLSRWYANLKHRTDRNLIARQYDLDESNLTSFLHHLSIVRNLCAHHARLWNREFAFRFKLPRGRPVVLVNKFARESNKGKRIYNTLLMLAYFLDVISPGHHWKQHLNALIEKYGINVDAMGFPEKWQESILWK